MSIFQETREAWKSGGYFTEVPETPEVRIAFKQYINQATGRVPSVPKSPEEKLKNYRPNGATSWLIEACRIPSKAIRWTP